MPRHASDPSPDAAADRSDAALDDRPIPRHPPAEEVEMGGEPPCQLPRFWREDSDDPDPAPPDHPETRS